MTVLNISKRKIYKRRRDGQVAQGATVSSVIATTASSGGVDPVALQDYAKKVDVHAPSQKAFLDALSINSNYITYNALGVSVENADKLGGVVASGYWKKTELVSDALYLKIGADKVKAGYADLAYNADRLGNVVAGNYARKDTANIYGATQTINADLYVNGNIIHRGTAYTADFERVQVQSNLMQLNLGEPGAQITGVIPGTAIAFSGIEINRGTADPYYLGIVEGANPLIKLGKAASLVTVAARADSITDNYMLKWDNTAKKIVQDRLVTDYWHKDNSNLSTVDWKAKTLAANQYLRIFSPTTSDGGAYLASDATSTGFSRMDGSGAYRHRHMRFLKDGACEMYHGSGSVKRFETTLIGTKITGDGEITGNAKSNLYNAGGFTGYGWNITPSGDAELDNLTVRKTMRIYELLVQKIRSINGSFVISPANGKIAHTYTWGDSNEHLRIILEEVGGFFVGDRIRCQQFTGIGIKYYLSAGIGWMSADKKVIDFYYYASGWTGSDFPEVGDDIVQWGSGIVDRQGMLYITSADSNSPYLDVLDGVNGSDMTGKVKLRLGKLSGISGQTGYGIWGSRNGIEESFVISSDGYARIAGISFDDEKLTAGNVQIWKTGDIINTAPGTPYAFYGNGNFSLGKGQIGYNYATNIVTFGAGVKMTWDQITGTDGVETTVGAQAKVDALSVGGANMLRKSGKFSDTGYWASNGGGIAYDTEIKYEAYGTLKTNLGAGLIYTGGEQSANWVALEPNTTYTYSALVKLTGSYGGSYNTPMHFHLGNAINDTSQTSQTTDESYDQSLVANKWKVIYRIFTTSSTTKYIRPFIYIGSTLYGELYVAYVKLERGNKATGYQPHVTDPIEFGQARVTEITNNTIATTNILAQNLQVQMANVTGTLSASQINALSITGDKIAAGTITTTKLAALTITAEKIASGTITADKLNVTSVQASLITTDYIEGLSLDFDKGMIGNFIISSSGIYDVGNSISISSSQSSITLSRTAEINAALYVGYQNSPGSVTNTGGVRSNSSTATNSGVEIFALGSYGVYVDAAKFQVEAPTTIAGTLSVQGETTLPTVNISVVKTGQMAGACKGYAGSSTTYLSSGYMYHKLLFTGDVVVYLPLTADYEDGVEITLFTTTNYNAHIIGSSGRLFNDSTIESYNLDDAKNNAKFVKFGNSWYMTSGTR